MKWTKNQILTVALGLQLFSFTTPAYESPIRAPDQDWTEAAEMAAQMAVEADRQTFAASPSAKLMAVPYTPAVDASNLPEWTGTYSELQTLFIKSRDLRLYAQASRPDFPRRATWLYPVDGCYERAAHVGRVFEASGKTRPGKVYAFGNLGLATPFDRSGKVYWWYHVAAAFRYGKQVIVFDASADPYKPLALSEWLSQITRHPNRARVAFCDSRAYMPSMTCVGGSERQERISGSHQRWLLASEWKRLESLGLSPESLLGDSPPWKIDFPWSSSSTLP